MIHEILQSDVEVARGLIRSDHPDPEIVAALTSRGIEPAKATQLLDDLHHGRKPAVQVLVVPRPSGDGVVGSPGAARGDAPQEKHSHRSRSRSEKHHRSGIPWWFAVLILIFLGALVYAFLETGSHASKDAVDQSRHELPPPPGK